MLLQVAVFSLLSMLAVALVFWLHLKQNVYRKTFFVMGPPFSGKSKGKTAAKLLGLKYIGTGDLLRAAKKITAEDKCEQQETAIALTLLLSITQIAQGNFSEVDATEFERIARTQGLDSSMHKKTISLAITISQMMKDGKLIPDEWIAALYRAQIRLLNGGLLVDGIPRSIPQLDMVDTPHGIILFHLRKAELLIRAGQRAAQEPDRPDNHCDVFVKRIREWEEIEDYIIAHYAMKGIPIKIVSSTGPYWWGVLKTLWAFAWI